MKGQMVKEPVVRDKERKKREGDGRKKGSTLDREMEVDREEGHGSLKENESFIYV